MHESEAVFLYDCHMGKNELDEDAVKIALKKIKYALSHVLDEDVVMIVDLLLFKRRKLRNGTRPEGG